MIHRSAHAGRLASGVCSCRWGILVVMLCKQRGPVVGLVTTLVIAASFTGCGRSGYEVPQAARCSGGGTLGRPIELGLSAEQSSPVVTASVGEPVIVDSSFDDLVMRVPRPVPAARPDVCLLGSHGATATFLILRPGRIGFVSSAAHAGGAMDPLMSGTVVATPNSG